MARRLLYSCFPWHALELYVESSRLCYKSKQCAPMMPIPLQITFNCFHLEKNIQLFDMECEGSKFDEDCKYYLIESHSFINTQAYSLWKLSGSEYMENARKSIQNFTQIL